MDQPPLETAERIGVGSWLLIALAYVGLGRLALLLAIPPGYATAIFPPSGLALYALLRWGNRAFPGILLGSFVMNLTVSWHPGAGAGAVLLCAIIGSGAALQALFGAWLAGRRGGQPLALSSPQHLFRVLLLGGLLACTINASVGVGTLWAYRAITWAEVPYSWWTWWVGDTIGVALTVPAIQMILSKEPLWRRRRLVVGLPLAVVTVFVVLLFVRVSAVEERNWNTSLAQRNERIVSEFKSALDTRYEMLTGLEGLFHTVPDLRYQQFTSFLGTFLLRHPDIRSMEWVPRVAGPARKAFESAMTKDLGHPYHVRAFNPPLARWEEVSDRLDYFPIAFVAPAEIGPRAEGMDLGSLPPRRATLNRCRDEARPALVVWTNLAQDVAKRPAMSFTFPIYRLDPHRLSVPERREALLGYAVGIFYTDDLMKEALHQAQVPDTGLELLAQAPQGQAFSASLVGGPPPPGSVLEASFDYYGTRLSLRTWPTSAFLRTRRGWQVFLVLAAGLTFTGILGALLLLVSGRAAEAETLAEQRGRAIVNLEAQAMLILSHAVEPILTLDQQGRVEAANAACLRLLGWEREELRGRPVSELIPGLLGQLRKTDATGSILELQGFHRSGDPIPLEVGFNAVELEHRVLFAIFLRDLRERRRVERLKSEFLAVASHELRTPLTSLRGSLGLIENGVAGEVSEQARTLLRLANENAKRLGTLVDDLLDMEKLERAQLRLDLQPEDLTEIMRQALEAHLGYASRHAITLDLAPLPPPPVRASVDAGRLLQVLGNLLSNAIKMSPAGATVTLSLTLRGELARCAVRDQGPGVPEAFRNRLFEKFTQADSSERRGVSGTGLGLAIAKALTERMGGVIGFRNESEGGATFFVDLPLL